MKLKDCSECDEVELEYGFTLKQAHSYNHQFRFVNYRTVMFPLRWKGIKRKQLISNGGKLK